VTDTKCSGVCRNVGSHNSNDTASHHRTHGSERFASYICLCVRACVRGCVYILYIYICIMCGSGSSVGIVTELRAGRFGIEFRWGRDFPQVHTGPGVHPASCKMGTRSFPGVKSGRGVTLTTHPLLVPRSWRSRAIPLPTLWATPGL